MSIYDKPIRKPKSYDLACGKCGGTEFYAGVQTMAQGRTNTFTKDVQLHMCKKCDIQMVKTINKRGILLATLMISAIMIPIAAIPVLWAISNT